MSEKEQTSRKVGQAVKAVFGRLRFIALFVIVGVVAAQWETIVNHYQRWARPAGATDRVAVPNVEYYCPMHPQIVRDTPGNCPICGMPLSKRAKSAGPTSLPEGVLAQVQMTPEKMRLGRIATTAAEYRLLGQVIRTVGEITYDETRRRTITARIKGRLDELKVNYTGQKVQQGDVLAKIYSPDLLVAQEELLSAARSAKSAGNDMAGQSAQALLEGARKKLSLWGITDEQIDKIIKDGKIADRLEIRSPMTGIVTEKKVLEGQYVMDGQELYTVADLGQVWMQANIYEQDIGSVRLDMAVAVEAEAYPNESFPGKIAFIAFKVDPETRTIKARIEIKNPEYKLKPGMNVVAKIGVPIGEIVEANPASQPQPDTAGPVDTRGIANAYLAISAALAQDKPDAAAATKLAGEALSLAGRLPAARRIAEQAGRMPSQDLIGQRDLFRTISEEMIRLLQSHPADGLTVFKANCPMGNGGNWLTAKREVVNPYQGLGMLTCGSVDKEPLASEPAGAAGAAGAAGIRLSPDGRYEYGYYCPVQPDRLFAKPDQCPIDNMPFTYMRVERVLAVPESAVIFTGERAVVYREAAPGWFDEVQIQVGRRAGEFYQVVDGLKPGDRVVTRGAFAVDAENRLNPAIGAQYSGAGGSPKSSDAHTGHTH